MPLDSLLFQTSFPFHGHARILHVSPKSLLLWLISRGVLVLFSPPSLLIKKVSRMYIQSLFALIALVTDYLFWFKNEPLDPTIWESPLDLCLILSFSWPSLSLPGFVFLAWCCWGTLLRDLWKVRSSARIPGSCRWVISTCHECVNMWLPELGRVVSVRRSAAWLTLLIHCVTLGVPCSLSG